MLAEVYSTLRRTCHRSLRKSIDELQEQKQSLQAVLLDSSSRCDELQVSVFSEHWIPSFLSCHSVLMAQIAKSEQAQCKIQ